MPKKNKTKKVGTEKKPATNSISALNVGKNRTLLLVLLIILMIVILPIPIGVISQSFLGPVDAKRFPPPGTMVDMGSYQLHIYCLGTKPDPATPTVILEAGLPEWSLHWRPVQQGIASFTRVCAYDRAGFGWSKDGPDPRSAKEIVAELHTLLQNAGEHSPYILVAHSLDGPEALLYQHDYPDEISGLVMVDAWSPEILSPLPRAFKQSTSQVEGLRSAGILGLVRIMDKIGLLPLDSMFRTELFPTDLRPVFKAAIYRPNFWDTWWKEIKEMDGNNELYKGLKPLGNLPLTVIKSGKRSANDFPSNTDWDKIQSQLMARSSNSTLLVADQSRYDIRLQQPEVVVNAVRHMIQGQP